MRIDVNSSLRLNMRQIDPRDYSNLVNWYDTSRRRTVTYDGSNVVSDMEDESGNDNDLVDSVNNTQDAVYNKDSVNGHGSIQMTSKSQLWTNGTLSSWPSNEVTVFMVARHTAVTSSVGFGTMNSTGGAASGSNRLSTNLPWNDNIVYWDCGDIASGGRVSYTYDGELGEYSVWCFTSSATNNRMRIFRNNILKATVASYSTYSGTDSFGIGGTYTGDFCEFMMFSDEKSDNDIAVICDHLIHKWGVIKTPLEVPDLQSWLNPYDYDTMTLDVSDDIDAIASMGAGLVGATYVAGGKPHYDHVLAALVRPDGEVGWIGYQRIILPEGEVQNGVGRVKVISDLAPVDIKLL